MRGYSRAPFLKIDISILSIKLNVDFLSRLVDQFILIIRHDHFLSFLLTEINSSPFKSFYIFSFAEIDWSYATLHQSVCNCGDSVFFVIMALHQIVKIWHQLCENTSKAKFNYCQFFWEILIKFRNCNELVLLRRKYITGILIKKISELGQFCVYYKILANEESSAHLRIDR